MKKNKMKILTTEFHGVSRKILLFFLFSFFFSLLLLGCDSDGNPITPVTITFDTAGGSVVGSIAIAKGSTLPTRYFVGGSDAPTKQGYDFDGWKISVTAATVTNATTFDEDATLIAQWKPTGPQTNKITIAFDTDGGSTVASVQIDAGGKLPADYFGRGSKVPVKSGYDFICWKNGNEVVNTNTTFNTGTTLTAQWEEEEEYVVEYAQSPAIHPGNHFQETFPQGITTQVNTPFGVNGQLFSNIERDAGVLSAQWYRNTVDSFEGGTELEELRQTAEGTNSPHELTLRFSTTESTAGTYWYWVVVTNTNVNATISQTSSSITQNKLKVTVTE